MWDKVWRTITWNGTENKVKNSFLLNTDKTNLYQLTLDVCTEITLTRWKDEAIILYKSTNYYM